MELRHLRHFIAVAEELHFQRAAERLRIDQSPLSRSVKALELEVGTKLFARDTKGTQLTSAGQAFLEDVRRIFIAIEQAKSHAISAAAGSTGTLRVALSDGTSPSRLASLLAQCREEEPEVDIRIAEVPWSEQLRGLRGGHYDVGLSRSNEVGEALSSTVAWREPLAAVIPQRHPLLIHREVPLADVLSYPLVLCKPETSPGCTAQFQRLVGNAGDKLVAAEYVGSLGLMVALVSAGFGVGFTTEMPISNAGVVTRPIAGTPPELVTYLVYRQDETCSRVERFLVRACGTETVMGDVASRAALQEPVPYNNS